MNVTDFATRHIKAILFVTIVLCAMGVVAYSAFPVSILPDVTFPRVIVIAESGDRPVKNLEVSVTRPIEEAVSTLPEVKRVQSRTERGSTEVSINFAWGTDVYTAEQLVNARVNQIRPDLPADTSIEIERMNPTVFPVLGLTLNAKNLTQGELYDLATYNLKPRLSRVPGVARVVIQGGQVPEYEVEANVGRLQSLHLSLEDLSQAISKGNVVRSVGKMDYRYQRFQVVVTGETIDEDQMGSLVVTQKNGVPVLLSQVAKVKPSFEDKSTIVAANGSESVLLNIIRQPSANTVSMVSAVRAEISKMKPSLPKGVDIGLFYDQSTLIKDAVQSVEEAVLIGAVLAVVVLMMFLGDLRATVVTAAIIPATVLITFLIMRIAGLTLNLMTLGALAVGIGLVIDDAIVVVENVFRHMSVGDSVAAAVRSASREIASPMISSTLTTVVVFLPLVMLQGVAGAFFTALAITLAIALMVSLGLALMASPSLCAAFLRNRKELHEHGRLFSGFLTAYERLLRWMVRRPWSSLVLAIAAIATIVLVGPKLPTGFMPSMDEGAFILDYLSPPGTTLEESNRLLVKVDKVLKDTPEIDVFSRRTGTELGFSITEPNKGDYAIVLKQNRKRKIEEVISDVRKRVQEVAPGLDIDFSQVLQDLIGDLAGDPAPIEIKLFGEDQAQLEKLASDLADKLGKIKGLVDIKSGVVVNGPVLSFRVDPVRAGRVGMSADDVATQADDAMFGNIPTKIIRGDRQIPVRVRYPLEMRNNPEHIGLIPIHTPSGADVPLGSLAEMTVQPGLTEGTREDQRRMIGVTMNLEGLDLGSAVTKVKKVLADTPMPAGVSSTIGGLYESQTATFDNFISVLAVAMVLVFVVMLFQFGSFTCPTVIMLLMPLSLAGAIVALYCTGTALNVSSFMGSIMLVGVVVKNGILLLDRVQHAERNGVPLSDAIVEAGHLRLRPILMTTLTAMLGLFPLALGLGAGAEMQQPLAIAVIGGLGFSTILTLLVSPILYSTIRQRQIRHHSKGAR
ncbi:MAG: efflux RND transporter permease subunit [Fimbriimonas sp.]|nr:efflux RND transporter permease subunit [Fimbriimonas sp.]